MDAKESFCASLAEFGAKLGCGLALDPSGVCNFTVDGEVEVELRYFDESDTVVVWTSIGRLPRDGRAGERALALLALDEPGAAPDGCTLSMDPETRMALAHCRCAAEELDGADDIAAKVSGLVELAIAVREDFADRFPCDEAARDGEEGEV